MKDLQFLIDKFGQPDALIDNHVTKKYGYAIWGFKDIFKYDSSGIYLNNHKIQIIDIHTGNTLDEFYELWTGGRRLSEDGILYQNGRYNFYSIKPNTEW